MPTKVGLGSNHPQSYMVEQVSFLSGVGYSIKTDDLSFCLQWLARTTKMRSLSSSLSEVDTIMMNHTPALVDSDSTTSQPDSGPHTPHSRLLEEPLLATIHDDRCLSELQNPAPYRYSTEYYPYEVLSKI